MSTSAPSSDALQAALAADGFQIEEAIGTGGSSVVYRARDLKHGRSVAVKVLRPDLQDDASVERFHREMEVLARLRHPNILPLYDSGVTSEGARYFVMPLVAGTSLRTRLAQGPLPVEEAVRLASEVADALGTAHAAGIVHRDVKPENILLEAGHAVVVDFGLALPVVRASAAAQENTPAASLTPLTAERITGSGVAVGTIEYMSPEQAAGDRIVDGRSDTYSLGCVVYEMLAGHPPWSGKSAWEVLASRFAKPPAALTARPDVPPALDEAVSRAMSVDPADRFTSVQEFATAMRDAIAPSALGMPESGSTPGRWRLVRRTALVVAFVIAGGFIATMRDNHEGLPRLDRSRIVVAVLSNETGDSTLDPIAHIVTEQIRARLATTALQVVTSATIVPALRDTHLAGGTLDDPARLGELARETQAATVVSGSYFRANRNELAFMIEITDARSGDLLRTLGPVRGARERVLATSEKLSQDVAAAVDSIFPSRGPNAR